VYENILLLLDCSPVDEAILNHVVELARIHNSRVHLFHVVHAHTLDQQRVLVAETQKCLSRAQAVFEKQHIPATCSFSEGEPSELVLAKVTGSDFDLVALATHGHRGISDVVLGSVSRVLKHDSDKPILLLRGRKQGV
jgi:nucleotide-binding universal stress UspA family protein